jgi:HdeA/HdeB family
MKKHVLIAGVLISGAVSNLAYAADSSTPPQPAATGNGKTVAAAPKKPLGKLSCEEFVALDDVIKPQYVIASVAYTKGGKAKNAVVDIIDTDTVVPELIETCRAAPKESFWDKLKHKLKL